MAKLTINVDAMTVVRAKRYAARHGTSLSRLVEQFLDLVSGRGAAQEESLTPVLARLRRAFKDTDLDVRTYRRHLRRKYR